MDSQRSTCMVLLLVVCCLVSFVSTHEVQENSHGHYTFRELLNVVSSEGSLSYRDVQMVFQKLHFVNCNQTGQEKDCNRCFSPTDLGLDKAASLNATEFTAKAPVIVYYLMPEQYSGSPQLSAVCNSPSSLPSKLFVTLVANYSAKGSEGITLQALDRILERVNTTLGKNLTKRKCFSAESIIDEVHKSSSHEQDSSEESTLDEDAFQKACASIVFHLVQGYCISDSLNHSDASGLPPKSFFLNDLYGGKKYLDEDDLKKITTKLGIANSEAPTVASGGQSGHNHKRRRRSAETNTPHNKTCFSLDQMLDVYGISHSVGASQTSFKELCPAFIQQMFSGVCTKTAAKPTSAPDNDISKIWGYGFLTVTVISLVSLIGVATVPFVGKKMYKKVLAFLVALAVGSLAGDGILHLIPHAFGLHEHKASAGGEHGDEASSQSFIWKALVVIGSIYAFYLFEVLMHFGLKRKSHAHSHVDIEIPGPSSRHMSFKKPRSCSKLEHHEGSPRTIDEYEEEKPTAENGDIILTNIGPQCHSPAFHRCLQAFDNCTQSESDNDELLENVRTENGPDRDGSKKPKLERKKSLMKSLSRRSVFSPDEHEKKDKPKGITAVAWMIIVGDTIHNISDGLAIGAAFSEGGSSGISGGISTSIAVFCHELPHELGDFAVLLTAGMSIKMALLANFLSACSCYLGLVVGILIGQQMEVRLWIFSIAGGMFIYVALVDMLPDLMHSESLQTDTVTTFILQNTGFLLGITIMLLIALFEEDLMAVQF